jgi:hypothetical protein
MLRGWKNDTERGGWNLKSSLPMASHPPLASARQSTRLHVHPKQSRHRFDAAEDFRLIRLVNRYGADDWISVKHEMPGRSARQCRERYMNYLSTRVTRAPWTQWEEEYLHLRHEEIWSRWALIAEELKTGRSSIDVQNRWKKHLSQSLHKEAANAHPRREESIFGEIDLGIEAADGDTSLEFLGFENDDNEGEQSEFHV